MSKAPPILTTRDGPVGILTINRPETLNALDIATLEALERELTALEADSAIRVIVVTGAGDKAFIAGGDIADLASRQGLSHYLEFAEVIHRVFRRFEASDKPTIGAINGWALGGGTELALCLDIRLAAETARFGLPEITLGIFPGAGGTQRLMRQVAPAVAKELMFTGRRIEAADAMAIGLVNRLVPAAELMAETMKLAQEIAAKSPLVLKLLKRAILHGRDMPEAAALAYEQAMISLALDSTDAHEGLKAFLEKRKPEFRGK
jgi:enoyl-CoA hydratase